MLTSLALIFLVGLSLAAIFGRLKLPRLVGMLLSGILLGPFVLDLLDLLDLDFLLGLGIHFCGLHDITS
jgi:Kef-type K+ transport system membrane component KefB